MKMMKCVLLLMIHVNMIFSITRTITMMHYIWGNINRHNIQIDIKNVYLSFTNFFPPKILHNVNTKILCKVYKGIFWGNKTQKSTYFEGKKKSPYLSYEYLEVTKTKKNSQIYLLSCPIFSQI
jgi:hypothetical protein